MFGLCDKLLASTDSRDMRHIRTYSVIPFSRRLGIIEFVPSTTTYKLLAASPKLKTALPKFAKSGSCIESKPQFLSVLSQNEKSVTAFRAFIDNELEGCKDLVTSFKRLSRSPAGFFYLRRNFIITHAQLSTTSW